jgi:hypothetical protein
MSNNPYTPPTAPVSDVDPRPRLPRPRQVTLAIVLFWISVAFALPDLLDMGDLDSGDPDDVVPMVFGWVFALAIMAVLVWVIVSIGRAKNWARWTYLVLAMLGWVYLIVDTEAAQARSWSDWLEGLIDVAIIVLLFLPASNAWFRARGLAPEITSGA